MHRTAPEGLQAQNGLQDGKIAFHSHDTQKTFVPGSEYHVRRVCPEIPESQVHWLL